MLGLSVSHLALILLVIILIFGTAKLRNIGQDLGGAIKGFKDTIHESDDPLALNEGKDQPTQSHESSSVKSRT
ncbi:twin-arginine translocase TatA/TatE family subunit [Aquirhabdus sp.]|uniref:twin-arginine translocase TatA/TatE family subunit n=1 Tax=Aquirhabdus sp. TaxID=2824160 RepID=UPI00396CC845